jgi:hypothetical protein
MCNAHEAGLLIRCDVRIIKVKESTFQRDIQPPSSGQMMEAICSSKTSVSTYKFIWH